MAGGVWVGIKRRVCVVIKVYGAASLYSSRKDVDYRDSFSIIATACAWFSSEAPIFANLTMPCLSTTIVRGKLLCLTKATKSVAFWRCVHVNLCGDMIGRISSLLWREAERKVTLGKCSFHSEGIGISRLQGVHSDCQKSVAWRVANRHKKRGCAYFDTASIFFFVVMSRGFMPRLRE